MNTKETKDRPVVFRQSKRVVLRPLEEEDIPLLVRWINDPEITRFLKAVYPMTIADEKEWLEQLRKNHDKDIVFMIVAEGKPIGVMGLHRINWIHRWAKTGAVIGEKGYWGKGYGSEAKMLVLDYAFNSLGLHKICSSVIAFNTRSFRYSLKCGYEEEGRRKDQYFIHGRFWDEIQLAVFKKDWLPLWRKFKKEHGIKS